MARAARYYAPGALFHITGRTSNREFWLVDPELRDQAVIIIGEAVQRTDVELIAYNVMSNHLHLLIRQGIRPLAAFAQPIFRRLALRVHKKLKREGHIFKGSYFAGLVDTVDHLRHAIEYIHNNPVEAEICKTPGEYAWSSCTFYSGGETKHLAPQQPLLSLALEVFASGPDRSRTELQADYCAFANYQQICRALPEGSPRPASPMMHAGEELYKARFGSKPKFDTPKRIDLADIVKGVLRQMAPKLTVAELRLRRGGAAITAIRREIVKRGVLNGHRGVAIADCLNISQSAVSAIASKELGRPELRQQPIPQAAIVGTAENEGMN